MLHHGLYEQVINNALNSELAEIPEARKAVAPIDKAEASKVLAQYLADVVQKGLDNVLDNGGDISAQIALTNQIVDLIQNTTKEADFAALGVDQRAEQLLALLRESDPRLAVGKTASDLSRPETSIAQSSLFTGAIHEPQMYTELKKEIVSADRIDMLVSFIKWSGLRLLMDELREFTQNGGELRIITTSYMGATDVKAIEELRQLPNTKIKVSYDTKRTRLHAKTYVFYRDTGFTTAYVGSSNLSNAAISSGLEWNVKVTKKDLPETIDKIMATFESYWNSNEFEYYSEDQKERLARALNAEKYFGTNNAEVYTMDIAPYSYQQEILDKLDAERTVRGYTRNLVVAATGTGKTVISALDYKRFRKQNPDKPCRLLFVAHREEILKQSMYTFRAVLKDANFGEMFVGSYKPESIDNLFISIQTFNSQDFTAKTTPEFYDYIIVDEFHHAAAPTYQKLLAYYQPRILLGLTATPERMDGKSVLPYFNNRIAAEIRLPEAIDRKLLCPFQYFGVTDTVDLDTLKWSAGGYDTVAQLRKHRTAITADGMLYQGYVARMIRRELMDDAFIGRRAVSLRISRLQEELALIENELRHWSPISQLLSKQKEPLFTQYFVQNTVVEKQHAYLRGIEINGEIASIDEQLSKLDLLWLDEQRKTIALLGEEIVALNKEKEAKVLQIGQHKERIRQLDFEVLPDHYQKLTSIEDRLQDEFPDKYQQSTGIPRYQQELSRLKRADVVHKNFSNRLEQSVNERETTRRKLFTARKDYTDRFKPCSFRVESMDNDEYEAEQRLLEESELPKYREKIRAARESAMEQFQNDFLAKLKSSIDQVQDQVRSLNRALRQAQFGTDSYQFRVERNPDYAEYYDMIMAPELMEGDIGLLALPFQDKYGHLIEKLFGQITMADDTQLNARKQSELQENIQRYTDFRTYLKFDLETTDQNGSKQLLSQTLNTKSGGETQTPFYIAVLASFAQLYRVNDTSSFGNTVRLAVFDEAFNKMDSDRIIESVRLLRKMGLQAIICTPPDKVSDIMPIADRTLLVDKNKYKMHILPFGKEMAQ